LSKEVIICFSCGVLFAHNLTMDFPPHVPPKDMDPVTDIEQPTIPSATILLPTKLYSLDANHAHPHPSADQPSVWSAQPVLQWVESLACATEELDRKGPVSIGGAQLSQKTSFAETVMTDNVPQMYRSAQATRTFGTHQPSKPFNRASGSRGWDLTFIESKDPHAWSLTQQISSLSISFEELVYSKNGTAIIPTAEIEKLSASFQVARSRLEFTFGRIMNQSQGPAPLPTASFTEDEGEEGTVFLGPHFTSGETTRGLLDKLYEETAQKLKSLIAAYQKQRHSGHGKPSAIPSTPLYASGMIPKDPPMPKQEFSAYMMKWLRENWTNPYPDDEGVVELANHCGVTVHVISNWLINARTRKWRPSIVKASEMGRPALVLFEDSLNIFDGKPLRDLSIPAPVASSTVMIDTNYHNDDLVHDDLTPTPSNYFDSEDLDMSDLAVEPTNKRFKWSD
jgi:Homeobox KN domain